jgi:hypothetical protein
VRCEVRTARTLWRAGYLLNLALSACVRASQRRLGFQTSIGLRPSKGDITIEAYALSLRTAALVRLGFLDVIIHRIVQRLRGRRGRTQTRQCPRIR